MNAWVIYDSVFGNTEKIAEAIADALAPQARVELTRASSATPEYLADAGLLIVGSPTRGFRPTESVTEFLKAIRPRGLGGVWVAAFDTRFKADELDSAGLRFVVKAGGYAAKRIAAQLKKAGGKLVAQPEGFYVQDVEGPLKPGELERAANWARGLLTSS